MAISRSRPVLWPAQKQTLLWRFWLHAFDYLHLLSRDEQLRLCREWISANPPGSEPAWHPYPVSRRIINWCKADLADAEISCSLYHQTKHLYSVVETYLGGNHLLENARAMVFAGRYFAGDRQAEGWIQRGLLLFEKEIPRQILPDGWHYERSPMYHALMLEGILDVLNVLPDRAVQISLFAGTARRMLNALACATRPDGQLTLFNDATEEIAPPTARLIQYGRSLLGHEPAFTEEFEDAGYYIYRDDSIFIFIDGGPIGPDELPAHSHADIFSYELSVHGLPFIVDTGVYEYQEGDMRDHVRHTKAHNTVCIDGVSQAECWKSFRVARRYPPKDVHYEITRNSRLFRGRFDGYAHLIGDRIQHERTVVIDPGGRCISIEDKINGQGTHTVESRIHLHPDVNTEMKGENIQLAHAGVQATIRASGGFMEQSGGWYFPRMGLQLQTNILTLKQRSKLPIHFGYTLSY